MLLFEVVRRSADSPELVVETGSEPLLQPLKTNSVIVEKTIDRKNFFHLLPRNL